MEGRERKGDEDGLNTEDCDDLLLSVLVFPVQEAK
jgi:hypothetical protein